jgi:hypothetical protein
MATGRARSSASRFAHGVEQRRLDECLLALHATGWEQRLAPLAHHMTTHRLVRSWGYAGGHLRQLDLTLLHEALSRLLRDQWDVGSLILQLVVEGQEPAYVAAERGVSRAALVEQLRVAVGALASRYERLAGGDLNAWPVPSLRAALGGQRG